MYPIVIHEEIDENNKHNMALDKSIINSNENSLNPVITGEEGKRYQVITDGGRFTLSSKQHAYIYGLPRTGPYGANYSFTVSEIGTYTGQGTVKNNLYDSNNIDPLDPNLTTTFRSGLFSNDPNNDLFGTDEWLSGFEENTKYEGEINGQNKVEFLNTLFPGVLQLEKNLRDEIPDDFNGKFTFEVQLNNEEGDRFIKVPWLSSVLPEGANIMPSEDESETNLSFYPQEPLTSDENGIFNISLAPNEIIILYGLPLNTTYTITETGVENGGIYTTGLQEISVEGDAPTSKENPTVTGIIQTASTPPTENNNSIINASVSVLYLNFLSQSRQLQVRKLLRPSAGSSLSAEDLDYNFKFQIELTNANELANLSSIPYRDLNSNENETLPLTNGIGQFTLKQLQTIEFYDLPQNTHWEVQELNETGTPIDVYSDVNEKYFLSYVENDEGTLNNQAQTPIALFVNLKADPNKDGSGLKILSGNPPTSLQQGQFNFMLKGLRTESNGGVTPQSDKGDGNSSEEDSGSEEEDEPEPNEPSVQDSSSEEEDDPQSDEQSIEQNSNSEEEEELDPNESRMNFEEEIEPLNSIEISSAQEILEGAMAKALPLSSSKNTLAKVYLPLVNLLEASEDLPPMPQNTQDGIYIISLENTLENTGSFSFPEINFTKAGTYVYQLSEQIPENRDLNIEYDPIIYYVKVTVAPE
ncbi:MAG: hypothetical protein K2H85_08185, partial [Allobaculum sp.]|nr:hypothetical protein [Allobaculum sp.]